MSHSPARHAAAVQDLVYGANEFSRGVNAAAAGAHQITRLFAAGPQILQRLRVLCPGAPQRGAFLAEHIDLRAARRSLTDALAALDAFAGLVAAAGADEGGVQ